MIQAPKRLGNFERISKNNMKLQETKHISTFVSNRETIFIYLDFCLPIKGNILLCKQYMPKARLAKGNIELLKVCTLQDSNKMI
jgi:hypothetical protein